MAFAALDPFSPLGAVLLAPAARLDRLAIDAAGRRGRPTPCCHAHLLTQGPHDSSPSAVALPSLEVVVHGLPGREVPRQHPPGAAGPVEVEEGIDYLTQVGLARSTVL